METGWWFEQMIWRQIGAGSIWQLIFIANTRLHFYRILLVSEWMSILFLFQIPPPSTSIIRVSSINYHYPVFLSLVICTLIQKCFHIAIGTSNNSLLNSTSSSSSWHSFLGRIFSHMMQDSFVYFVSCIVQ